MSCYIRGITSSDWLAYVESVLSVENALVRT